MVLVWFGGGILGEFIAPGTRSGAELSCVDRSSSMAVLVGFSLTLPGRAVDLS